MKKKNMFLIGIGAVLATAAAFFFIRKKKVDAGEKTPGKAPQLDINNPGDQSEFASSPEESEMER
jgi:LPXTG-motif cell wall-anchored protein